MGNKRLALCLLEGDPKMALELENGFSGHASISVARMCTPHYQSKSTGFDLLPILETMLKK